MIALESSGDLDAGKAGKGEKKFVFVITP